MHSFSSLKSALAGSEQESWKGRAKVLKDYHIKRTWSSKGINDLKIIAKINSAEISKIFC